MNNRSLGVLALCAWFLLYGILALTNITFELQGAVMGILAIIVAILIWSGH